MPSILLLGKFGQLGWELHRALAPLGVVTAVDYPEVDLRLLESLENIIREIRPEVIVNATAYTAVDRAENEPEIAMEINAVAPRKMAELALELSTAFIHYSTDYVFDGNKGTTYNEEDVPNPLGVYGRSKLAGEESVKQLGGAFLILRTSWVYSLRRDSFVTKVLDWSRKNTTLRIVEDQISNPTWCRVLAEVTAQLLAIAGNQPRAWIEQHSGLYHLAGNGYASRYDWAKKILKLDPQRDEQIVQSLQPAKTSEFPTLARRPLFSALNCDLFTDTFGLRLPDWEELLELAMNDK